MRAAVRTRRVVTVSFWNQWIRPRVEHYADGSSTVYFGIGQVTWRTKQVEV